MNQREGDKRMSKIMNKIDEQFKKSIQQLEKSANVVVVQDRSILFNSYFKGYLFNPELTMFKTTGPSNTFSAAMQAVGDWQPIENLEADVNSLFDIILRERKPGTRFACLRNSDVIEDGAETRTQSTFSIDDYLTVSPLSTSPAPLSASPAPLVILQVYGAWIPEEKEE